MSTATPPPVRVLVVEPSGNLWGSERTLLANLSNRDPRASTIAVCLPPRTVLEPALAAVGVPAYPTFTADLHLRGRAARLRATAGLLWAALRFRPDVLHVNQAGATRIALAVGRLLRIPVTTHVQLAEDVAYLEGLGGWLRGVARVVCISDAIRSQFSPQGPVPPERIVTFYHPIDIGDVRGATAVAELPFVACVGRLVRTKGQDVLIDALAEPGLDRLTAVFVGSASDDSGFDRTLTEQAARLGVDGQIRWIGFDPEPAPHLTGAVALACTTHNEGFGLVIVEAWAAGTLPIAWAGSGGAAELIEKSGGGLLFDALTGASLAEALNRAMYLTPDERARLVEAGQAWARAECDPARQAARMTEVWQAARSVPA